MGSRSMKPRRKFSFSRACAQTGRGAGRSPFSRLAQRLARKSDGAAAVEFAIIAAPFFALLFAIFETTIVFFSGQALETGVANAARMIRTGQVQAQGLTEQQFRDLVCANQPTMANCSSRLRVDVRTFPNFGAVNLPPPLDAEGNLANNFVYQPGAASDVVIVRVFYDWDLLIPDPITGLSNMNGSKRLIAAGAAFRNEPF